MVEKISASASRFFVGSSWMPPCFFEQLAEHLLAVPRLRLADVVEPLQLGVLLLRLGQVVPLASGDREARPWRV